MPHWQPIDPEQHAQACWFKYPDYRFASADHLAPIAIAELTQVLPWYPIAFAPDSTGERYHLVALLSLQPGHNRYLSAEFKWQAPYVPSHYRGYPFALDRDGQLCIDTDSALFSAIPQAGAQPLIEQGALSPLVAQIQQFHQQRQQALALTQTLLEQLQQADLITPWAIEWQPLDSTPKQRLKGYFGSDEARLRNLPPEHYPTLAHSGALGLAYGQLFSQPRIAELQQRHHRARSSLGQPPQGNRPLPGMTASANLDDVFGTDGDDVVLDFDRLQ